MSGCRMIVAGYISIDITPAFPESYRGRLLGDVVRPGKLRSVGAVETSLGGCVTNTGLALHRLGAEVSLVAKIGEDSFGRMVQDKYRQYGAPTEFTISKDVDTSYTIVLAVPGNDRCFLVNAGANDHFLAEDIDFEKAAKCHYFHFGYPSLMRGVYADGGDWFCAMMKRMQETGLVTSLDPAMPDADTESGTVDWEGFYRKVLPYVDFFVPSIEELGFILDRERYESWQQKAKEAGEDICMILSLEEDVKPLARKALALGCGSVLLKCGSAGMYYLSADEERMTQIGARHRRHMEECGDDAGGQIYTGRGWGGADLFQDSYRPERVLSGTGAGDTAIAGFLYGISHGMNPEECLRIAAGCGSLCVTRYDTLSGLVPIPELQERIGAGWEMQHFIRP